jgi:GntR family transcriptional regulator, rspAB operon transcriptional repressor
MAELLRDSVYRAIRGAILTCQFQPGQELREQILAERYQVSRSPVRDSLLRLEQERLITVLPRQGYRVNTISPRDIQDLFGLRLITAPACAAEAARADDAAVRTLDEFRNALGEHFTHSEFLDHNRAFHTAVAQLTGNKRLAGVEIGLVEEFDRLALVTLKNSNNHWISQAITEHQEIISAIQTHDSDTAFELTYKHVAAGLSCRDMTRVPAQFSMGAAGSFLAASAGGDDRGDGSDHFGPVRADIVGADIVDDDRIGSSSSAATIDGALRPLIEMVAAVSAETRIDAEANLATLMREVAKGESANDRIVADLVEGLVRLIPGSENAVVSAFSTPILESAIGPVSGLVVDRLRGR